MIKNPEKLSLQEIRRRRDMEPIFGIAVFLGIWFDEDDIKYIKTKMMTDKKYRAICGKIGGTKVNSYQLHKFQDIWLIKFLDDPEITTGVQAFIIAYTGHHRGELKSSDEYNNTHKYNDFICERFIAERWMETCMHTRSNKKHKKTYKKTTFKKLSRHGISNKTLKAQLFIMELKSKGVTRCH